MRARRIILAVLALSAFLCVLYSGERFFLWVLTLVASVFVIALLNIAYTLRYITLRQSVWPAEVTAGEYGAFVINIHNRGFFPLAHMDIWYDTSETLMNGERREGPDSPQSAKGSNIAECAARGFVTGVMPGAARTIREEFYFPYRGLYTPRVLRGKICDIFGLVSFTLPNSLLRYQQFVTVLPRVESHELDSLGENPFTAGADRGRYEQEPYSVADIRFYQPGDPIKRVHWKLSARTRRLQVKEFDSVLSQQASVFLDLSPHGYSGREAAALEDRMCSRAAAVCKVALDRHMPLRFIACSKGPMALSCGTPSDLIVVRRFLAGLPFDCPYSFREVIRMELEAHPETGDIVIITATLTSQLAGYVDSLSAEGRTVKLLHVSAGEEDAAHA